jgi:copper homeostasis protein
MIRPRSGDFCYSAEEFAQMLSSVHEVKATGAAGVVFGILLPDKTLDKERMKTIIEASRPMKVVCHKAFDETPNGTTALEMLIELGVDEVLTSGHCKTAVEGVKNLAEHVQKGSGKIKIMAGGTVRAENV